MPTRPRRNSAAIASLRMIDAMEDIESTQSSQQSEASTPLRRVSKKPLAKAPQAKVPQDKASQRKKAKAGARPATAARPTSYPTARSTATRSHPPPARVSSAPNSNPTPDDASQSSFIRSRLEPFINSFEDGEQDRVTPRKRSVCYLDSEDEERGKRARSEVVEDEVSLAAPRLSERIISPPHTHALQGDWRQGKEEEEEEEEEEGGQGEGEGGQGESMQFAKHILELQVSSAFTSLVSPQLPPLEATSNVVNTDSLLTRYAHHSLATLPSPS